MILDLSCVVHIIPMVKCLVDIYLCFGGYYEIQCLWGVFGIHYFVICITGYTFCILPLVVLFFLLAHTHIVIYLKFFMLQLYCALLLCVLS